MLSLIISLLHLPINIYTVFVIEQRFGFNHTTLKLWATDLIKSLLLSCLLLASLLYVILWFMEASGRLWWIYAFLSVSLFQLSLIYIYPIWLAPLFNKFTPLTDGPLKTAIDSLCHRLRFDLAGVSVMDGSKRSAHANAHFTGFGRNRRVVLFDTLIDSLKIHEVVAVLAHEIGHAKRGHIKRSVAVSLACMLPCFWAISKLMLYPPLFQAFGFDHTSNHAALVVFVFATGPIMYLLSPLFSLLSRRFEYEADRFVVEALGKHDDLAGALLTISKKSLSNINPHPWYSFFHYSHPTLVERIQAMKDYQATLTA